MFYTQMNCLIDDLNDNIEQYQQKHLKSAHLRFASNFLFTVCREKQIESNWFIP